MQIDMEKARAWLDAPSSLVLSNGRAQRILRIVPVVTLLLVLVYFYNDSQSDTNLFTGRHKLQTGPSAGKSVARPSKQERKLMDAAGNATLGFGSIQFINLPSRFDRIDAAAMQAYLSGLDITEVPGVLSADINEAGMPPQHLERVKKGEKGCWRAHANVSLIFF
ncbi:hypothetical protein NLG97_g5955 [Lecanicillium saksenae]|uniref:Uncharacterized protein n=1 Tax=Lecanicillium saksenae TaxID=468837 RepID=A0ACC1QU60_9HYPO|nr:hypothetical protein NLG97_g5955 [Lecanicillium saksenae]